MIEVNKKYVRKDNGKGEVVPFEIKKGRVSFSHVGYFDWRERTIESFLEIYKLKEDEE